LPALPACMTSADKVSLAAAPDAVFKPCTAQKLGIDFGNFGCGPHVNFRAATYTGVIFWEDHSAPGSDDDYNFDLHRADQAGMHAAGSTLAGLPGKVMHLELDSDETIDRFKSAW